jgi:hypothetical protein
MARVAAALLSTLALGANPQEHGVSDGFLKVQLPSGWSSAIGPGVVAAKPAAYMLVAEFRLRSDAAMHEAPPAVPAGKVLISLGDCPVQTRSRDWPRVTRLRLPSAGTNQEIIWHVRYARRAISVTVWFGSRPTAHDRRAVDHVLSRVTRVK